MKNRTNLLISLLLTIVLLWFFFYKTNLNEVFLSLKKTNIFYLFIAIIFNLTSVILRIFRLHIFLLPIKKTSFKNLFVALFSSYFISTILPGRLGEISKPLYIAAEENISKLACITTSLLERLFDLFTLFIFFSIFLLTYDIKNAKIALGTFYKTSFFGIFFLFLIFIFFFLWIKIGFSLPIFKFFNPYIEKIRLGLESFKSFKQIFFSFLITLAIWLLVSFFTYFILKSFDLKLPFFSSFMLLSVSAIGFIIPTPGGAGGVHKAFQIGLVFFYSLEYNLATAVSIIGHFFAMMPVALVGFISLLVYGIPLSKILNFAKINKR